MFDRKLTRLQTWDYSLPDYYFVTICTKDREHLFGRIKNGNMIKNHFGKIVIDEWHQTMIMRPYIALDEFVLMPNHIHYRQLWDQ